MRETPTNYLKVMFGDVTPYVDAKLRVHRWLDRKPPVMCESGYHFVRNFDDLVGWAHAGDRLWICHVRGERIDQEPEGNRDGKGCAESMKLVCEVKGWHTGMFLRLTQDAITNRRKKMAKKQGVHYLSTSHNEARRSIDWPRTKAFKYVVDVLAANGVNEWGD